MLTGAFYLKFGQVKFFLYICSEQKTNGTMVRIFNADDQTLIGKCKEQEKEQKMSELAEIYADVDVDIDGDIVVSNDD